MNTTPAQPTSRDPFLGLSRLAALANLAFFARPGILSVYSGRAGACMCGCAGLHRYASAHAAEGARARGYQVDDEDVNDRQVARVLNQVMGTPDPAELEFGEGWVTREVGGRIYAAYLTEAGQVL